VRVDRDELVEFQVDGTDGSAVVGLFGCRIQPRTATPKPVWNPDLRDDADYRSQWLEVPDNEVYGNGFRAQWEDFLQDLVAGRPHPYDLLSGARGVALAEAGLRSSAEGRRVDLPELTLPAGVEPRLQADDATAGIRPDDVPEVAQRSETVGAVS
ncbi:gfo/Idh/MocA family oxidoreductase, partial [Curtobacterium flaccumfaciens pv. poinsettiae]|nr:gfo/Idh/MocA family oxidoreductase [Curtobacterium flaccumfaciens pv. poinsettiae]